MTPRRALQRVLQRALPGGTTACAGAAASARRTRARPVCALCAATAVMHAEVDCVLHVYDVRIMFAQDALGAAIAADSEHRKYQGPVLSLGRGTSVGMLFRRVGKLHITSRPRFAFDDGPPLGVDVGLQSYMYDSEGATQTPGRASCTRPHVRPVCGFCVRWRHVRACATACVRVCVTVRVRSTRAATWQFDEGLARARSSQERRRAPRAGQADDETAKRLGGIMAHALCEGRRLPLPGGMTIEQMASGLAPPAGDDEEEDGWRDLRLAFANAMGACVVRAPEVGVLRLTCGGR